MTAALGFLLPALYGALFAQYAVNDIPAAIVSMVLAIAALKMYEFGWLNWVPLEPFIAITFIPIIGTIAYSKVVADNKTKKEKAAAK